AEKKTIMAVFAHADDEIDITPLLSKYSKEGHNIYLVIATKGEKGFSKREVIPKGDSLALARALEANCACEKLGINPPILLEMGDGTLGEDFTGMPLHKSLDSLFRLYKPDVVITWGPEGGYGHIDHRMVSNSVTEIFQSGKSQFPKKLFYTAIPTEHFETYPTAATEDGRWLFNHWKPVKKEWLTVRVHCEKVDTDNALKAMDCYKTQFTDEEMEDNHNWLLHMNRDTVFLRPFIPLTKIEYTIL